MKIHEIILEISNRQRREQKAAQKKAEQERLKSEQEEREKKLAQAEEARREKRRRMMAGQLAQKQREPEPIDTEIDDSNPFAEILRQQELEQKYEQDNIFGVEVFFKVEKNAEGGNGLYVYWTTQTTPDLDKRRGMYQYFMTFRTNKKTQGEDDIPEFFKLINQLVDRYKQVYILFDEESMKKIPQLKDLMERLDDAKKVSFKKKLGYDTFSYRENEDGFMEEAIKWDVIPSREQYFHEVYSASQREKQNK